MTAYFDSDSPKALRRTIESYDRIKYSGGKDNKDCVRVLLPCPISHKIVITSKNQIQVFIHSWISVHNVAGKGRPVSILDFLGKRSEEKVFSTGGTLSQKMMDQIQSHMGQDFGEQPEKKAELDRFCIALEQELKEHVKKQQTSVSEDGQEPKLQAVDALSVFHVSEDHMEAYACILSPLNGGSEVTQEHFLEDMRYSGITFGIDSEAVSRLVSQQNYLRIVQVAQGEWPADGEDGELEELFERRSEQPLELSEDELREGLDFRNRNPIQSIRKEGVICRIKAPVMAREGSDVSGRPLVGKAGMPVHVPQGENTRLSEDGLLLLASIGGIVITEGENFTVQKLNVVEKDIDASAGALEFDGNVLIQGNVKDNVTIRATGNIIIEGSIFGGNLISGGTIRVQGEIKGNSEIQLQADKQIQCTVMERAVAVAKEDLCAEIIADSTVISEGGCIYAMMGRGLIVGGYAKAYRSIFAKKVGNVSGCENSFILGYAPDQEKQIAVLRTELEETQGVCEKLRKNISDMQAAGMNRQRDKRELYNKVVEQQTLYEDLKKKKSKKLKELEIRLHSSKSSVALSCDEIHPLTRVYIRGQELVIQSRETDCHIHMPVDQILLK